MPETYINADPRHYNTTFIFYSVAITDASLTLIFKKLYPYFSELEQIIICQIFINFHFINFQPRSMHLFQPGQLLFVFLCQIIYFLYCQIKNTRIK